MNIKNNQRSRDTEARVEAVFFALLAKKHISKITVRELCEGAEITRTSFYGHYEDIYDLLRKVENRIAAEILEFFREELQQNHKDLRVAFIQTFRYIERNKAFFRYFMKNADTKEIFTLNPVLDYMGASGSVQEQLRLNFFIGGLNTLLKQWLESGCRETPEEIWEALPTGYVREL